MKTLAEYAPLIDHLKGNGEEFYEFKVIEGHGLCALHRYMFTIGLVCGLDEFGYKYRYCYPLEKGIEALVAIVSWDGKNHPSGGWIKRKGYGGEISNENR